MSDINVKITEQQIKVKMTTQEIKVRMVNPSTNIIYGTGDPPEPNDYPEGTVFIKYIP